MPLRRGIKVCSSSRMFRLLAEPEQLVAIAAERGRMKPRPASLHVLACHGHRRKSINLRRFMQGNKNPLMALLHDQKL
jgi:hypothetical protein